MRRNSQDSDDCPEVYFISSKLQIVAMIHICRQLIFTVIIYMVATGNGATMEDLESIFLRLYIGTNMDEYIDYSLNDSNVLQTKITNDQPTVLYIHGFTEDLKKESVQTVVQAYLKRSDHNIIAVDYSKLANESYMKVVKNIGSIGTSLAMSLNKMVQSGFNPEKLHIVAHSMGSQVAGYIGRKVSFQIPRITGLDPAGPFFNIFEPHLSFSDAQFVDIIHTDAGFYGIALNTGTVDFYPNGGRRLQPGCPQNFTFYSHDDFCSHHRSWRFYAESLIVESAFLGVQCPSSSRFFSGECNDKKKIIMGYDTPSSVNGRIYLQTAMQSPFGLQEKGARVDLAE